MDAFFNKYIQKFNPQTGERLGDLAFFPKNAGVVSGLLYTDDGYLYVATADFSNPGIMIYDTNRGDYPVTPLPVDTGLRPTFIVKLTD